MLAAAGLSNKQIGQQLFLSHRTVGAHLYQIFPKLGITSRAALRDALASLPPRTAERTAASLNRSDRAKRHVACRGHGQMTDAARRPCGLASHTS